METRFKQGDVVYNDIGTTDIEPTPWRVLRVEMNRRSRPIFICENSATGEVSESAGIGIYTLEEVKEMRTEAGF